MGFFSNLFGKKSKKLTKEQVEEIEGKVEESEAKHIKDKAVFSNLLQPARKVKKPVANKAKKSGKKMAKKSISRKAKKRSKKKGRK